tara:strand:- start:975 stop:1208 length:234 start_codon:yes stop_codon:yes gene_type:complete
MLSFEVEGNLEKAIRLCGSTKLIVKATSLGSTESLIEASGAMKPSHPAGLVRLSVGIEDVDDIICDLKKAFEAAYAN